MVWSTDLSKTNLPEGREQFCLASSGTPNPCSGLTWISHPRVEDSPGMLGCQLTLVVEATRQHLLAEGYDVGRAVLNEPPNVDFCIDKNRVRYDLTSL